MGYRKFGVFLARLEPPHNAHLWNINRALEENDYVAVIIGSSNKEGTLRNPFSIELRKELLHNSLKYKEDIDRVMIFELPDWSTENCKDVKVWGHYLYYNIVSRIGQKHFSIYYSDDPKIISSWFDDEIKKYITIKNSERSNIFDGLSATKIRNSIIKNDKESNEYLKKMLPEYVYGRMGELRNILVNVYSNPKNDFSMK